MHYFKRLSLALVTVTTMLLATMPQRSDAAVFVGIGVNVDIAPPALPVYVQPAAPYPNAIWQPGYWAWGPYGYYWVPGVWVAAPQPGYLWTPGYWGWGVGYYRWHPGYWATRVGFYGGINYGFGYFGTGFVGGGWFGGVFRYNTAVVNVNTTVIRNTYVDRTVIVNNYNTNITRVSYNGGTGGVRAFPTADERAVAAGPHLAMTSAQRTNMRYAQQNRNNLYSVNNGRPMDTAGERPFSQSNPSQNFERVNAQDRANATSLQSHVYRSQSQSQYRSFGPQAQQQYHPQTYQHPQQQSQYRRMGQAQPNRYQHGQSAPVEHSAPHPRQTGRPRPPR
jgi:hypothetical protein